MKFENIVEDVIEHIFTRSLRELSQLTRYKIAHHFGVNQNYLSGRFKEGTQMTLWSFLNSEKMRRAEFLLRIRHDLSVETISKLVGCEKCHLFNKNFRKVFGINPGKYRSIALKLPPFCIYGKQRCVQGQERQPGPGDKNTVKRR